VPPSSVSLILEIESVYESLNIR